MLWYKYYLQNEPFKSIEDQIRLFGMFMRKMVMILRRGIVLFTFFFFFKLQLHSSVWANVINSGTVEVLCPNLLEQKSREL